MAARVVIWVAQMNSFTMAAPTRRAKTPTITVSQPLMRRAQEVDVMVSGCAVILPRLRSDFLSAVMTQLEGGLGHFDLRWSEDHAVTIVMANEGYPGSYEKGSLIKGLDKAEAEADVVVFHAGTSMSEAGEVIATGGRVLAVTATGDSKDTARAKAYDAVAKIDWPEGFCRTDIANT